MGLRLLAVALAAGLVVAAAAAVSPTSPHGLGIGGNGLSDFLHCDLDGDGIGPAGSALPPSDDVDGDGVPNRRDADIDGDCVLNGDDRDVDGDGLLNGDDRDVDGDGLTGFVDRDIDGDGIPNHKDDDSDGTGDPNVTRLPEELEVRVPDTFFGVIADDLVSNETERPGMLAEAAAIGVGTIRQTFDWALVEHKRGRYDWAVYDDLVADVTEAGLSVLPILFNPPAFHSSRPRTSAVKGTFPPKRNRRFARFAKATARRYGPDGAFWKKHPGLDPSPLRAWQVWNEPNLGLYWRPRPDPAEYTRMLRVVGRAIRRADPDAEIVAAGLPHSRLGMTPVKYLERMYDAGAQGSFDTFALHPYAGGADAVYTNIKRVRELLDANGDRETGLWVTEIGWATGGPAHPHNVGEQGQADMIRRTLATTVAHAERLRLRGVIYYNWRDLPHAARDRWGLHSGLLRRDGSEKLGYRAFSEAAALLAED